uniref:Uncharacterized protein n=1 Tax=Candidatus Kentrum sp. LFY TaxID=2126342 RepID=A0A450WD13_9GAMM|nr:MAG: hypothetical protein BECKLFY1418C_GA0070996_10128 [Candidatus Kentron sp. LFY]
MGVLDRCSLAQQALRRMASARGAQAKLSLAVLLQAVGDLALPGTERDSAASYLSEAQPFENDAAKAGLDPVRIRDLLRQSQLLGREGDP